MEVTVEIKNIDKVRKALDSYPTIATKHIDGAIKRSIFKTQELSKNNSPVRTGYLRRSHVATFQPLKGILEPIANYAMFVHEGTRFMRANPFLRNALNDANTDIQGYFEKGLNDTMEEIARMV